MKCIIPILLVLLTACKGKTSNDYFNEAEALAEQQKYEESSALLDEAIEKDQRFIGAYINRGANKSALGDYNGAIEDYQKILEIDSVNTLALFNTANNFKRLEKYDQAVYFYNKAFDSKGGQLLYLDYTPNSFTDKDEYDVPGHAIHFERGIAHFCLDSLQRALADLQVSVRKNYMVGDSYYWMAHVYLRTGQGKLACDFFSRSRGLGNEDAAEEIKRYCR